MPDDPYLIELFKRVAVGEQGAWDEIVERYAPLLWSICARYRLDRDDCCDVVQTVWVHLVESIENIRDPAALPGWLATTTRRECIRVLRAAARYVHVGLPADDQMPPDIDAAAIDEEVLRAERNAALRAAFAELEPKCRELLSMTICDPPCRYEEISAALGMAKGSIGPTKARCLKEIRRSRHLRWLLDERTG